MSCGRAEELLLQAGYDVDARNISVAEYRTEMLALGFDAVPTIVVRGRAFSGFPEEVLRREIGLPMNRVTPEQLRERVANTILALRSLLAIVPHIPDRYWDLLLVADRNRPFAQWVWHIFEIARVLTRACERGVLTPEDLQPTGERKYWTTERDFPTFSAIAIFGQTVVESLEAWSRTGLEKVANNVVETTTYGNVRVTAILEQVERHSAVHLWQAIDKLTDLLGEQFEGRPSPGTLARIPFYVNVAAD